MCGINGFIDLKNQLSTDQKIQIINKFNTILSHRGPDNSGSFFYKNISMGHTRLSVIDLSQKSNQPMLSSSKKNVLSYNGEIYNFLDLKNQLKNINFKTDSDTEILVEYLENYGLKKTIENINGMYSFCLANLEMDIIYLSRDIFGEKPLYYYLDSDYFVWGSEINIFFDLKICSKLTIDYESLRNYFDVGYVPSPKSIFTNIKKLLPGETIIFDIEKKKIDTIKKNTELFINKKENLFISDYKNLLIDSVKKRTISDVPYGVFLSSGVDSSLIAGILQSISKNKISSFSIGIKDSPDLDESDMSNQIAKYYGTDHNELMINENDLLNCVEEMPRVYGEPFSDSSQIPTFILAKFSRNKITVALSGDGGDEIFCGYNRYLYLQKYKKIINFFYKLNNIKKFNNIFFKIINKLLLNSNINNKIQSIKNIYDNQDLYERLVRQNMSEEDDIFKTNEKYEKNYLKKDFYFDDALINFQYLDIMNYLPDDILTKVDRASMAHGLEVRCPFLDTRLIQSIFINSNKKIFKGNSKYILREILKTYLDPSLISKKKQGFAIPINKWMRQKFKYKMNVLINSAFCKEDCNLDFKKINLIWNKFLKNNYNNTSIIWSLYNYLTWKKYFNIK
jgi:asparagine synthase (glutamine-hydrolysing)